MKRIGKIGIVLIIIALGTFCFQWLVITEDLMGVLGGRVHYPFIISFFKAISIILSVIGLSFIVFGLKKSK
jgi:hypothetical protein